MPRADHGEERYRGHDRLASRRALSTGDNPGIGRAVAIAFAREGVDVAFTAMPGEAQDARDTVSWIERARRRRL